MCTGKKLMVICCSISFFKQKTAYEMRISDWSSDVCSSDLVGAAGPLADPAGRAAIEVDQPGAALGVEQDVVGIQVGMPHPQAEIGRASCRERVCPYV